MFGKLFERAYTGSMMGSGEHVFAVWGYVVAHAKPWTNADGEDSGLVELNPRLLATMIGTSEDRVAAAVEYLSSPDDRSRSKKCEGRRIVPIGAFEYEVPTLPEYRRMQNPEDRKAATRERVRRHRERAKPSENGHVTHAVTPSNACNAIASASASGSTSGSPSTSTGPSTSSDARPGAERGVCGKKKSGTAKYSEGFELFWRAYPRRCGKRAAWNSWKRVATDAETRAGIMRQTARLATLVARGGPEALRFTPHPATWLNQGRWLDEPGHASVENRGATGSNGVAKRTAGERSSRSWSCEDSENTDVDLDKGNRGR
jgi:hypothetical protein